MFMGLPMTQGPECCPGSPKQAPKTVWRAFGGGRLGQGARCTLLHPWPPTRRSQAVMYKGLITFSARESPRKRRGRRGEGLGDPGMWCANAWPTWPKKTVRPFPAVPARCSPQPLPIGNIMYIIMCVGRGQNRPQGYCSFQRLTGSAAALLHKHPIAHLNCVSCTTPAP